MPRYHLDDFWRVAVPQPPMEFTWDEADGAGTSDCGSNSSNSSSSSSSSGNTRGFTVTATLLVGEAVTDAELHAAVSSAQLSSWVEAQCAALRCPASICSARVVARRPASETPQQLRKDAAVPATCQPGASSPSHPSADPEAPTPVCCDGDQGQGEVAGEEEEEEAEAEAGFLQVVIARRLLPCGGGQPHPETRRGVVDLTRYGAAMRLGESLSETCGSCACVVLPQRPGVGPPHPCLPHATPAPPGWELVPAAALQRRGGVRRGRGSAAGFRPGSLAEVEVVVLPPRGRGFRAWLRRSACSCGGGGGGEGEGAQPLKRAPESFTSDAVRVALSKMCIFRASPDTAVAPLGCVSEDDPSLGGEGGEGGGGGLQPDALPTAAAPTPPPPGSAGSLEAISCAVFEAFPDTSLFFAPWGGAPHTSTSTSATPDAAPRTPGVTALCMGLASAEVAAMLAGPRDDDADAGDADDDNAALCPPPPAEGGTMPEGSGQIPQALRQQQGGGGAVPPPADRQPHTPALPYLSCGMLGVSGRLLHQMYASSPGGWDAILKTSGALSIGTSWAAHRTEAFRCEGPAFPSTSTSTFPGGGASGAGHGMAPPRLCWVLQRCRSLGIPCCFHNGERVYLVPAPAAPPPHPPSSSSGGNTHPTPQQQQDRLRRWGGPGMHPVGSSSFGLERVAAQRGPAEQPAGPSASSVGWGGASSGGGGGGGVEAACLEPPRSTAWLDSPASCVGGSAAAGGLPILRPGDIVEVVSGSSGGRQGEAPEDDADNPPLATLFPSGAGGAGSRPDRHSRHPASQSGIGEVLTADGASVSVLFKGGVESVVPVELLAKAVQPSAYSDGVACPAAVCVIGPRRAKKSAHPPCPPPAPTTASDAGIPSEAGPPPPPPRFTPSAVLHLHAEGQLRTQPPSACLRLSGDWAGSASDAVLQHQRVGSPAATSLELWVGGELREAQCSGLAYDAGSGTLTAGALRFSVGERGGEAARQALWSAISLAGAASHWVALEGFPHISHFAAGCDAADPTSTSASTTTPTPIRGAASLLRQSCVPRQEHLALPPEVMSRLFTPTPFDAFSHAYRMGAGAAGSTAASSDTFHWDQRGPLAFGGFGGWPPRVTSTPADAAAAVGAGLALPAGGAGGGGVFSCTFSRLWFAKRISRASRVRSAALTRNGVLVEGSPRSIRLFRRMLRRVVQAEGAGRTARAADALLRQALFADEVRQHPATVPSTSAAPEGVHARKRGRWELTPGSSGPSSEMRYHLNLNYHHQHPRHPRFLSAAAECAAGAARHGVAQGGVGGSGVALFPTQLDPGAMHQSALLLCTSLDDTLTRLARSTLGGLEEAKASAAPAAAAATATSAAEVERALDLLQHNLAPCLIGVDVSAMLLREQQRASRSAAGAPQPHSVSGVVLRGPVCQPGDLVRVVLHGRGDLTAGGTVHAVSGGALANPTPRARWGTVYPQPRMQGGQPRGAPQGPAAAPPAAGGAAAPPPAVASASPSPAHQHQHHDYAEVLCVDASSCTVRFLPGFPSGADGLGRAYRRQLNTSTSAGMSSLISLFNEEDREMPPVLASGEVTHAAPSGGSHPVGRLAGAVPPFGSPSAGGGLRGASPQVSTPPEAEEGRGGLDTLGRAEGGGGVEETVLNLGDVFDTAGSVLRGAGRQQQDQPQHQPHHPPPPTQRQACIGVLPHHLLYLARRPSPAAHGSAPPPPQQCFATEVTSARPPVDGGEGSAFAEVVSPWVASVLFGGGKLGRPLPVTLTLAGGSSSSSSSSSSGNTGGNNSPSPPPAAGEGGSGGGDVEVSFPFAPRVSGGWGAGLGLRSTGASAASNVAFGIPAALQAVMQFRAHCAVEVVLLGTLTEFTASLSSAASPHHALRCVGRALMYVTSDSPDECATLRAAAADTLDSIASSLRLDLNRPGTTPPGRAGVTAFALREVTRLLQDELPSAAKEWSDRLLLARFDLDRLHRDLTAKALREFDGGDDDVTEKAGGGAPLDPTAASRRRFGGGSPSDTVTPPAKRRRVSCDGTSSASVCLLPAGGVQVRLSSGAAMCSAPPGGGGVDGERGAAPAPPPTPAVASGGGVAGQGGCLLAREAEVLRAAMQRGCANSGAVLAVVGAEAGVQVTLHPCLERPAEMRVAGAVPGIAAALRAFGLGGAARSVEAMSPQPQLLAAAGSNAVHPEGAAPSVALPSLKKRSAVLGRVVQRVAAAHGLEGAEGGGGGGAAAAQPWEGHVSCERCGAFPLVSGSSVVCGECPFYALCDGCGAQEGCGVAGHTMTPAVYWQPQARQLAVLCAKGHLLQPTDCESGPVVCDECGCTTGTPGKTVEMHSCSTCQLSYCSVCKAAPEAAELDTQRDLTHWLCEADTEEDGFAAQPVSLGVMEALCTRQD